MQAESYPSTAGRYQGLSFIGHLEVNQIESLSLSLISVLRAMKERDQLVLSISNAIGITPSLSLGSNLQPTALNVGVKQLSQIQVGENSFNRNTLVQCYIIINNNRLPLKIATVLTPVSFRSNETDN